MRPYAIETIRHLTHSALHRCLQRHGISRLPDVEGDKPKRQQFKRYPIGHRRRSRTDREHTGSIHIDIAEVQTAEGRLYLFVAIDRTSKFASTRLVEKDLIAAVPYRRHTVLTVKGVPIWRAGSGSWNAQTASWVSFRPP